jgi:hypothetical protein
MTTTDLPLVGTIGLTTISGEVGKLIEWGQFLNGQGFKPFEHAFLLGPEGKILEAEPGGAKIGDVSEYSEIYWCTNIAAQFSTIMLNNIWVGAQKYVGTKYSFLDYDAIAVHRLHIPVPGLKHYIGDTGHMICSQLCDQAYYDQGAQLFKDVWQGYVTPLGIYNLDEQIKNTRLVKATRWRPIARPRTVKM